MIQHMLETFADALVDPTFNPRWSQLRHAADYVLDRHRQGKPANLLFVCTHNSRRSQFAHVWAEVFAHHYGLDWVHCGSGGTEVTACNERTVAALERAGFQVQRGEGDNPIYQMHYAPEHPAVVCHSSLMSDTPWQDFAAMMCCADVDEKCPLVPGAAVRIPLHYDDPKSSEGTESEAACYDERCRQIGRDMMLLMATVQQEMGH